jgi:predicted regulator of Ras-like GTPase activity (Roadblock/LC7/MglB family)
VSDAPAPDHCPDEPDPYVEDEVAEVLRALRNEVKGVLGCLVATSDGLLIHEEAPDLQAPQIAALTSTMTALARHAVEVTHRGVLLDALVRGSDGHLAVFAIGDTAVLAVIAHPSVTVAWLHLKTRPFVRTLTGLAGGFQRFYTGP